MSQSARVVGALRAARGSRGSGLGVKKLLSRCCWQTTSRARRKSQRSRRQRRRQAAALRTWRLGEAPCRKKRRSPSCRAARRTRGGALLDRQARAAERAAADRAAREPAPRLGPRAARAANAALRAEVSGRLRVARRDVEAVLLAREAAAVSAVLQAPRAASALTHLAGP